jgi:hypothetical protein
VAPSIIVFVAKGVPELTDIHAFKLKLAKSIPACIKSPKKSPQKDPNALSKS